MTTLALRSWWRHQMETFSALLAIWAGNSPVTCEFPVQRLVTRSFDFFLICAWINVWVNNGEVGDLRRHRVHYDVTVILNHDFWTFIDEDVKISWGICIIFFITTDLCKQFPLENVHASIYVSRHYFSEHTCVKNITILYLYQIREMQLSWIFMQCKMLTTETMARVGMFQFSSKAVGIRFIDKLFNLFCASVILISW